MRSSCFDIPINNIIHNDLEFYVKSGYGGKHIKDWPFYCFIKMWVRGEYEQSQDLWVNWLVHEFSKYRLNIKSKGGMFQGSVHQNALKCIQDNKHKYWLDPSGISKINTKKGAKLLVDKRIEMIQSVMNKGYQVNLADPIFAVRRGGLYVLKGGHHRASIMHILGYDKLPGVIVYSKLLWECRKWLVKIKKFLK
jgi:hypothetical protein